MTKATEPDFLVFEDLGFLELRDIAERAMRTLHLDSVSIAWVFPHDDGRSVILAGGYVQVSARQGGSEFGPEAPEMLYFPGLHFLYCRAPHVLRRMAEEFCLSGRRLVLAFRKDAPASLTCIDEDGAWERYAIFPEPPTAAERYEAERMRASYDPLAVEETVP